MNGWRFLRLAPWGLSNTLVRHEGNSCIRLLSTIPFCIRFPSRFWLCLKVENEGGGDRISKPSPGLDGELVSNAAFNASAPGKGRSSVLAFVCSVSKLEPPTDISSTRADLSRDCRPGRHATSHQRLPQRNGRAVLREWYRPKISSRILRTGTQSPII